MTRNSKMGGVGKLSQFSGIKTQPQKEQPPSQPAVKQSYGKSKPSKPHVSTASEKLSSVNIKIPREQQEWLLSTAQTVRDNNDEPVPPGDRVYPQHLINVAIELLRDSDIEWSEVRNIEDLKQQLDL